MRNTILVSKEYIDRAENLKKIEKIGEKLNFRIEKENLYSKYHDMDFYIDKDIEMDGVNMHFIGIDVLDLKDSLKDKYIIEGVSYFMSVYITHSSETYFYLDKFINEYMTEYPEMLVTNEDYEDFYSLNDINNES